MFQVLFFFSNSAHISEIRFVCDGQTDGPTDGQTHPFKEMRECILKEFVIRARSSFKDRNKIKWGSNSAFLPVQIASNTHPFFRVNLLKSERKIIFINVWWIWLMDVPTLSDARTHLIIIFIIINLSSKPTCVFPHLEVLYARDEILPRNFPQSQPKTCKWFDFIRAEFKDFLFILG